MDRYEDCVEKFNEKQSQCLGILRSCCGVEARGKIKDSVTVVTALEILRKDYTPLGFHLPSWVRYNFRVYFFTVKNDR
jgi:hypothetical protein